MSTPSSRVMDERLFASVLTRERRRTDRSNRPFVELLIQVRAEPGRGTSSLWKTIIDVLDTTRDDTDLLGWARWPHTLGVIVADVSATDVATTQAALEAEVHRQLAKRLDEDRLRHVSIRSRAYPAAAAEHPSPTVSDVVKRMLDVMGSLTLLAIGAVLLLLIAGLVRLSSRGPVLFRQTRIGYRNRPFTMLKFRTMYVDADPKVHQEFVSSFINGTTAGHRSEGAGLFKLVNDPRVTPIGRFLRKTSLDELPQLWNVARGDMSLVGPRPPIPYELDQYKGWHRRRLLEAKPGITGLWQVTGRSRTTFDEMVRLDLRYVRRRSLWMDIKLLLATPGAVISGKGAC